MAFDAFIKFPGIDGESKRKEFEGQIEIYSFSIGASNPTTIGAGGGAGAGKVSISSFNFMKKTDTASPLLFQKCCIGDHFDKVTVTLNKAGKKALAFLKYDFEHVFVESIQWSGSSGGDDTPTESVSLAFAKVTITYTAQTDTGDAGAVKTAVWDLTTVASGA
jgi:type VI secretion system secreted protein Hcp